MLNPSAILANLQSGLLTAAAFLFVLSIVVVIHELGHFLVARWCGVKVDAFAMGFGREVYGWNDRHGTRWRLNWIPLGGYVKFMDDANGASMPDAEAIAKMTAEERATSFHAKKLWQRAAVIFAGPFANYLLAVAIFASLAMFWGVHSNPARVEALETGGPAARAGLRPGDLVTAVDGKPITDLAELLFIASSGIGRDLTLTYDRDGHHETTHVTPRSRDVSAGFAGKGTIGDIGWSFPARIEGVLPGGAAARADLRPGDVITKVDGTAIASFADLLQVISANGGREVALTFVRNGAGSTINITPTLEDGVDAAGVKAKVGRLGIKSSTMSSGATLTHYGPIRALGKGVQDSTMVLTETVSALSRMVRGRESAAQLGGPLTIAAVAGQAAAQGFDVLLSRVALISLSVGLFNLFPIPPLDGGHLLFYAAEAVRGRSLSDGFKDVGLRIGFALIMMLIVFVMWNDVLRLKTWISG